MFYKVFLLIHVLHVPVIFSLPHLGSDDDSDWLGSLVFCVSVCLCVCVSVCVSVSLCHVAIFAQSVSMCCMFCHVLHVVPCAACSYVLHSVSHPSRSCAKEHWGSDSQIGHMDISRTCTKKRVWRLLEKADLATLQEVEILLTSHVPSAPLAGNPTGTSQPAARCKSCNALRPPASEVPWPVRKVTGRLQGAVCSPCIWARRHSRDRAEWPGWQAQQRVQTSPNHPPKRRRLREKQPEQS